MLKTTRRVLWAGYWLVVAVAGLLALLVLLLRLLLPLAERYTDEVAGWLSQQSGATVEIDQLRGEWQGVFPSLRVQGLYIAKGEQFRFDLAEAEVSVNLSQSLLQFRPVFTRLKLAEPSLYLKVPAESGASSSNSSSSAAVPAIPLWLLDQPLAFEQGDVSVEFEAGTLHLKDLKAGLVAVHNTWQMQLNAQLGADGEYRSSKLVIEGQGASHRGRVWLYGELDGLAPSLLNMLLPADWQVSGVNLKQQFWARIQRGNLQQAQAMLDLRSALLGEKWNFEDTQLLLDIQPLAQGLQVQLHNSRLGLNDQVLELPVVAVDLSRDWQLKQLQLPVLELEPITRFLIDQPLPEAVLPVVRDLNLRGGLQSLVAKWESADLLDVELVADINQISMDAWDDVPQILGIDGRLEADASGGRIHLNSQDFTLNFPTLFPQGWRYSQADGVVGWRLEDDAAVIFSELLHVKQEKIEANGRFSLYLPFDGSQTELTLMIGTRGADGTVASQYIPPQEVGVEIHRWLDGAIQAGDVRDGAFLLSGDTRARLEGYQLPAIQMFFDVENAEFAYQPGWPAVRDGDAFMLYKDGALSVDVTAGRLLDSSLERAWVGLRPDASRVDVIGALNGDAGDIRTLLLESPLRELTGDELERWQLSGALKTDLALAIPLEGGLPDVDVSAEISGGAFSSALYRLNFTELTGSLRYQTPLGLQAEGMKTRLFGHESQVNIISERVEAFGNAIRTQVQLDSRIDIAVLRDWLELPFLNIASGETWYRARMNLCQTEASDCSGLDVRSSLQGIEVVGPKVLAKPADAQRYFQITSDLADEETLTLRYGDDVRARLLLKEQQLERGRIAFNRTPVTLPPDPGLRVIGSLPELEFERLSRLLERAGLMSDGAQVIKSEVGPGRAEMLHSVALNIGRFRFGDMEIENIDTLVAPGDQGWELNVASDMITGNARFPYNGDPYLIEIAGLNLERDSNDVSELLSEAPEPVELDPQSLPRSQVVVKQLRLDGKPLGNWSFVVLPEAAGAAIQNIQGRLEGIDFTGALNWGNGIIDQSSLTLKVVGGDLGDVLEKWGHGRALENKVITADLQLDWPGAPWQFNLGRSSGVTKFVLKNGRLVETAASSNFLRLFGILNLNSLGRRLRLDFSDLFEKGVAFDRIGGDYQLTRGVARTRKPFEMSGPSVDMKLNGQIDLVQETLDKRMEVTLPVTANLPVVGVLLGAAPQVAGAVFLIDKLIGDQLQKFTTIRYRMTGNWDDPKVTLPGEEKKQRQDTQKVDGK